MKYILLILITIILFFPMYWMFSGSFQNIIGIMKMPPDFIPKNITIENYKFILTYNPVLLWLANTILIVGTGTILSLLITAMAGYAFSVFKFTGKKILFWIFISSLMIPYIALFIPKFVLIRFLGLFNTWAGVILPLAFWPFGIMLFYKYANSVPSEILDSARLDGCTELQIIYKIMFPICKPILGALIIFQSLGFMNDFLWQNLILQDKNKQTLIVGLINSVRNVGSDNFAKRLNPIGHSLAIGVILFIPQLLIFISFSRYFIKGIAVGAIKE